MKKRILIFGLMSLLAVMSISAQANVHGTNIHFYVCNGGPTGGGGHSGGNGAGHPRGPILMPEASIDGYTLYIEGDHPAYELYLVDTTGEEPDVVYQITVPANVNVVYLPATFTGTFELQLYDGGEYYFYSEIEL
jgi:hypothetical protein